MTYLLIWYVIGLISGLIIDYKECKIVNKDYNDGKFNNHYMSGIRPPAYFIFITALGGLFNVLYLIYCEYENYQFRRINK